jgi:hypothetical protein
MQTNGCGRKEFYTVQLFSTCIVYSCLACLRMKDLCVYMSIMSIIGSFMVRESRWSVAYCSLSSDTPRCPPPIFYLDQTTELVFVNVSGAQESIPRN